MARQADTRTDNNQTGEQLKQHGQAKENNTQPAVQYSPCSKQTTESVAGPGRGPLQHRDLHPDVPDDTTDSNRETHAIRQTYRQTLRRTTSDARRTTETTN
jgi:hypothetical protein